MGRLWGFLGGVEGSRERVWGFLGIVSSVVENELYVSLSLERWVWS